MNQQNPNEIWQVEVEGHIYEAPFSELPEWIDQGSLQPEDKVRRGKLRWIEARRIPTLVPFFNARSNGDTPRLVARVIETRHAKDIELFGQTSVSATHPESTPLPHEDPATSDEKLHETNKLPGISARSGFCSIHVDLPAAFICSSCSLEFCSACPASYNSVKVCIACGSFCRPVSEAVKLAEEVQRTECLEGGSFGLTDLKRAIAHPFRSRTSLIFGCLMYVIFNIGQSVLGIGGIFVIAASIFCGMLANMLTFGILANIVENFTQGRTDSDFMPAFEDFSLWEDVVHPFFVGIGVYISSFGPFMLVCLASAYLISNAAGEEAKKYTEELAKVPGTHFYAPDRTVEQTREVRELLEKVKQQNERRLRGQQRLTEVADSGTIISESDEEERVFRSEQANLDARIEEFHNNQAQSTATMPYAAEQSDAQKIEVSAVRKTDARFFGILKLAPPLFVIGVLTFFWGLFYFPAACAVAGYSRSFLAAADPRIGLDTIKRLGLSYAKLVFFSICILAVGTIFWLFTEFIFLPLDLPRLGNLPSRILTSAFAFYLTIVFCGLVGYALARSANKLKLYR